MSLFLRLCLFSSLIHFAGTHIFPRIFHSDILSSLVASAIHVQTSTHLVTVGVLHSFGIVSWDRSLDLYGVWCASYARLAVMILELMPDPKYIKMSPPSNLK